MKNVPQLHEEMNDPIVGNYYVKAVHWKTMNITNLYCTKIGVREIFVYN